MEVNRKFVYFGFFVCSLIVFLPALASYFFLDDFGFLTISRYINNPLSFFTNDHFPGSFFYRPLGMLLWWVTYHLFGTSYELHNLINILIHTCNACVLFRIFCLILNNKKLNVLMALLFLVQPATISTTAWLSDRFDILTTLFILLTVCWFLSYRLGNGHRYYFLALAASVLAILSKETAYFTPVLVTIISVGFRSNETSRGKQVLIEIAPFFALMLGLYGVRALLLRGTDKLMYGDSLPNVIMGGISKWLHLLPDFFTFFTNFERFNVVAYLMLIAMLLILVVPVAWGLLKPGDKNWGIVALGLAIMLLPAILQAPVTYVQLTQQPDGEFSIFAVTASRFYYLSFAGFVLLANQLLHNAFSISPQRYGIQSPEPRVRNPVFGIRTIYGVLGILVSFNAILSYSICNKWSKLTNGSDRQVIEQASLALTKVKLPEHDCKLYFLNTNPPSWYFREFADSIIKALAPPNSQIIHCLVVSEKAPWYQFLLRDDLGFTKIAPLQNVIMAGQPVAPTLIDSLAYVYLKIPDIDAVATDPNAMFFEFDGNRFVDVSQQIRSGVKKVYFFDDRPKL